MAWVFLVDGVSFEVSCKGDARDPYDLRDAFESDAAFQSIKASLGEGFVLDITPDDDGDMKATLFIGVELHGDRHIYQGQTITCAAATEGDRRRAEEVADRLAEVVSRVASGLPVVRRSGIVLSQFD